MRTENYLLEIGTEELPPKSLHRLMEALCSNLTKELSQRAYSHTAVKGYATPRRLAAVVTDLAELQPDQEVERRGPAVKAAYDDAGEPTKALLGFARSCGIDDPTALDRMKTDKGEWVVFRQTKTGNAIAEEIEGIVTAALADLPIDRRMRWGVNRTEFVRPVHWIVSLYGNQLLPCQVLGLGAGRVSHGHRFLAPQQFEIDHADNYLRLCEQAFVIADFERRRKQIQDQLVSQSITLDATIDEDDALLEEVTSLVEWPVVLTGNFETRFLEVPEEVLISAMKEHQRYFSMRDRNGNLLPRFITVSNIASKEPEVVIAGNERVIRPRLADAEFFFSKDTSTPLTDKLSRLKSVVFQTDLGSYHAKAERISALAGFIADQIECDRSSAERAGLLAKADLVSELVGEFPDLQGIMGGHYASHDGEPEAVAAAIRSHYLPVGSGGALPDSPVACCVAVADKLDTLVGIFGIGQPPSGSRDPFALRRQSIGVIRIVIGNRLNLDLPACLTEASRLYGSQSESHQIDIADVNSYILDRLDGFYQDIGIDSDVVNAVRNSVDGIVDLNQSDRRIRAVHSFRQHENAGNLISANKRLANILKQTDEPSLPAVDADLFQLGAEEVLVTSLDRVQAAMETNDSFEVRLDLLAGQQDRIDQYFDDVMVMVDDEAVRNNRLATLSRMRRLFLELADFSLLQ